jgi:GTPase SAR1 family protein
MDEALVVGQGASGKTTLKEKLKDRNAKMPEHDATTRGIVIEPRRERFGDQLAKV